MRLPVCVVRNLVLLVARHSAFLPPRSGRSADLAIPHPSSTNQGTQRWASGPFIVRSEIPGHLSHCNPPAKTAKLCMIGPHRRRIRWVGNRVFSWDGSAGLADEAETGDVRR